MQVTKWRRCGAVAVTFALLGVVTAGCGSESSGPGASASAATEPANAATAIPRDLAEVLARDSIVVTATQPDESAIDADEALNAFAGVYDPTMFDTKPTLYSVRVESSEETRLPKGRTTWMIHIPSVEQDLGPGPVLPPDERGSIEEESTTVETDMFAFLDAQSGEHLATVYIGPPGS